VRTHSMTCASFRLLFTLFSFPPFYAPQSIVLCSSRDRSPRVHDTASEACVVCSDTSTA
jgi:hypothetical protein